MGSYPGNPVMPLHDDTPDDGEQSTANFIIYDGDGVASVTDEKSVLDFLIEVIAEVNYRLGTSYNVEVVDQEMMGGYMPECTHHIALFNKEKRVITLKGMPEGSVARCVECGKFMRFARSAQEVNDIYATREATINPTDTP